MHKHSEKEQTMKKLEISLPRNERDQELVNDLTEATKLFLGELVSKRLQNTLKIKIHVRRTTVKKKWGQNCEGVHLANAKGSDPDKDHKIIIHSESDIFETLAHELVHVKQIATKQYQQRWWKSDGELHTRWEGKELGPKRRIPYRQRPWEIEAFNLEGKLLSKWKNRLIDRLYLISKKQAEQSA
jgi:hypothetical protein|tara:strand:- start:1451 stop:2005 length:555 start_codon:yes stop_codon:yes gene_type:complete